MMKLLTLTPFVAAVVASSLQLGDVEIFARQNDPITSLVNDITTLTKSVVDLGDTVGGFTGISEAGTVATKAQTVQDNLQTAADNAKKAPTLDNNGALALAVPAQALNEAVVSTLDKITAKKDVFASASLTSVVAQLLEKDNQLAGDYSTALFSKVPAELKSTAMKIVQPSLDKLQKTVDDFKAAAGGSMSSGSSSVMTSRERSNVERFFLRGSRYDFDVLNDAQ
ncbi:uncharacterized protein MYCFIDRAFT_197024 [Pseudocercospora fijiensis CIRAD86]|uniref:Uncharacterized protein n=1 Tax=Pseudocercospora fijiensis (strain CIRAD86) TaxID=383855 RepID=M3AW62_PSEFD|nr:uncharacterized protein MYCFIDRAFT_197024 [Pseudocercospora fijiensis CIRAD86]EME81697.1 hypothetical protein MYCFIDRAFT_197024 [Pseudocercospora fijiensis CIRAD86]